MFFFFLQKSRVDPILRHSKVVRDVLRGAGNGVPYSTQGSHSFFATWAPHIAQALACRKFPYPQVSGMVSYTENLIIHIRYKYSKNLKIECQLFDVTFLLFVGARNRAIKSCVRSSDLGHFT